ncbi:MAG: hypothetical protein RIR69_1327 [Actinomycetota bacterium]
MATRPSRALCFGGVGITVVNTYRELCSLKTEEKTERQCGQHGGFLPLELSVNSGTDSHPSQTKQKNKVRNWNYGVIPPMFHGLSRTPPSLVKEVLDGEFDPGSGRTLAACLTHASRTGSML